MSDKENLNNIMGNIKAAFWQLPHDLKKEGPIVYSDDRDNHSVLFGDGKKGIRFQYVTDEPKSSMHNALHIPNMPIYKIANFLAVASPFVVDLLVKEIERLQPFEAEASHWKANHACEVDRARILKERPDMPIERVNAYDRMTELETENKQLRAEMDSLKGLSDTNFRLDQIHASSMDLIYHQQRIYNMLSEVFNRR